YLFFLFYFFFQAEDGIRDKLVTGVQRVLFRSGADQDHVAVEDAGVDHAFAPDAQQEVALLGHLGGEEHVLFDVLLGEDGGAGGRSEERRVGKEWGGGWGAGRVEKERSDSGMEV